MRSLCIRTAIHKLTHHTPCTPIPLLITQQAPSSNMVARTSFLLSSFAAACCIVHTAALPQSPAPSYRALSLHRRTVEEMSASCSAEVSSLDRHAQLRRPWCVRFKYRAFMFALHLPHPRSLAPDNVCPCVHRRRLATRIQPALSAPLHFWTRISTT